MAVGLLPMDATMIAKMVGVIVTVEDAKLRQQSRSALLTDVYITQIARPRVQPGLRR